MTRKLLILTASAVACGGAPPADRAAPETPADLVVADTATLSVPLALPAQLYVEHDAAVYARSAGVVESVLVDLGAPVRAGQRLALLESVDQSIALAQADAAFAAAQLTVQRVRDLAATRAMSVADSEQAETAFRRAELALRQARRDFDLTRIVSPFAGVVTARWARSGRMVGSGDSLFRVSALAPVLAAVRVPEAAAGSVRVGDTATVRGADGRAGRAVVTRASPLVDAASATREAVVRLSANSAFRPGETVTVQVGADRRQLLVIPASAVTEQGYVLVWEDGRPLLRAVTLGATLADGRIEVVSGLAPGERVVAQPGTSAGR